MPLTVLLRHTYVDGRYLITSAQPFLDGARTLIAQGYDPTRRMVMRRKGREHYDLAALLGVAAGLTVESTRFGRPTFRPYRGQAGVESASPIRYIRRSASKHRQPTAEAA